MKRQNSTKLVWWLMWAFFIGVAFILIVLFMTPHAHAEEPWGKLLASPHEIKLGETSTLTLFTKNTVALSISINSRIVGGHLTAQGGSMTVRPERTTTHFIELIGAKGERFLCSVTTVVNN